MARGDGDGVLPALSQGPFRLPQQAAADPLGYYAGWPLAGLGKRVISALIDYVLLWFGMLRIMGGGPQRSGGG